MKIGGAVGIAVCTYRRPEGLERLLAALAEACGDPCRASLVVVVDNDGSDSRVAEVVGRAAAATGADIRLFVERHPGISAARNRALAEAEAAGVRLLAMLDDDEWPMPGWLDALLARQRETGAVAVSGIVEPSFPAGEHGLERYRQFWSVRPQEREGRPFVHATSNVLIDLPAIRDVPRPLFDDTYGLSGGGDLVFFSRLFDLGKPMAWAERAVVLEEVPPARASWEWLRQRRFRVGNHMVMDEELRFGRLRPMLKTSGLAIRLAIYPLLGREPRARVAGWRMEAAKLRGRVAAHVGLRAFEYARDGGGLRKMVPVPLAEVAPGGRPVVDPRTVVVGIPTLNEAQHIEACVRGLVADDPWMRAVTVVIADGESTDGTRDVVRRLLGEFPNLWLVANPRRLQAAAMNLIVAAASEEHAYLVRCDAHAVYPSGYVRDAVERLARLSGDVAALATVLDARGSGGFGRAAAWAVDTPLGSGGSAHRGGNRSGVVDHGHHAAFRLDWFRRVGGYDESFRHNEDAELDHRLTDAGARIWLEADLRIGYQVREGIGQLAAQYFSYGRGRAQNLLKHKATPRFRQVLPLIWLASLTLSTAGATALPWLLVIPALYCGLLVAAGIWCSVAIRALSGLWAGPALAVIHNAWAIGFVVGLGSRSRAPRRPDARAASRATVATPGE